MRFMVELSLENDFLDKDKNRVIVSLLKNCFQSYSEKYLEELYEKPQSKDFTFSLFLGYDAKFEREYITIPSKKILLNFSAYESYDGLMFYNSILNNVGKTIKYKDTKIKIEKIILKKEKAILTEKVVFKILSPIVSRDHNADNKTTWYYPLSEEKGKEVFIRNFKTEVIEKFGDSCKYDLEDIRFKFNTKTVKVKNYSIEVLGNIGTVEVAAKTYILEYIYKAGIGSKKSLGFGMLDIVEGRDEK